MDKDLDILKHIITDYAVNVQKTKPRDFNADLPVLSTLGASNYDKIEDIEAMTISLEGALKKFVKDWKTLDQNKINYLMKYGIVQEVMKVEERKAIRREMESRPQPSPRAKPSIKKNNLDIVGV